MAERRKPGRPRADGPRYDSGRRKPTEASRGLGIWHFIKQHAEQLQADPRTKSELARLGFIGTLTHRQVEAGLRFQQVYAAFERDNCKRRSAASPQFERSHGSAEAAEERMEPDERDRRTALEIKHQEQWRRIAECFQKLPEVHQARVQKLTEELCVEDKNLTRWELDQVAPMLDYIGQVLALPASSPPPPLVTTRGPADRRRGGTQSVRTRTKVMSYADWLAAQPEGADPAQVEENWRTFNSKQMFTEAKRVRDHMKASKARRA